MKKYLLIPFLFLSLHSNAQVIAGGELYYELVGTNKYLLTAKLYRRCDEDPITTLVASNVHGGSYSRTINYTRTSIKKLNDTCGNPCNKLNAVSNYGYEVHTFEATVDFTKSPYNVFPANNICDVIFTISGGVRDNKITTTNTGYSHIEAGVNICRSFVAKNSSPKFMLLPRFEHACNSPSYFNNGALDTTDYDSLGYSLVQLKHDFTTLIPYKTNYSRTIPLTSFCPPNPGTINCKPLPNAKPPRGFYFSDLTGDFAFTPTNCEEIATIVMRVDEFRQDPSTRKWTSIGFVIRDFYAKVNSISDNNIPFFTTNTSQLLACNGEVFKNTIGTKDEQSFPSQKKADTVKVLIHNFIPNFTIRLVDSSAREPEIAYYWKPDTLTFDKKKYYFTVSLKDNSCFMENSRMYEVTRGNSRSFGKKYKLSKCGSFVYSITPFDNDTKTSFTTSITKLNSPIILTTGYGLTDSLTVYEDGQYVVKYASSNPNYTCKYFLYDTITINNAFYKPNVNNNKDSIICSGDKIDFKYYASLSPTAQYFRWYINGNSILNSDTFINNKTIDQPTIVALVITDNKGCIAIRGVNYTLKTFNSLSNNYSACFNTDYTLTPNTRNLIRPLTYTWFEDTTKLNTKDSFLTVMVDKIKPIKLTITDNAGCPLSDNTVISPRNNFVLKLNATEFCIDSLTSITNNNNNVLINPQYNWLVNNQTINNGYSYYTYKIASKTNVKLLVLDQFNCLYQDSILMTPINPGFELPRDTALCINNILPLKPSKIEKSISTNFSWTLNSNVISTDSFVNYSVTKNETIKLKINYSPKCYAEDFIKIYANENPAFVLPSNTIVCQNALATIQPNYQNINSLVKYKWMKNKIELDNKSIGNFTVKNAGYYSLIATNYNKCSTEDSLYISTLPAPTPAIVGNTIYFKNDNISLLIDSNYKSFVWFNGETSRANNFTSDILGDTGKFKVWCRVTDDNNCKGSDTVTLQIKHNTFVNSHFKNSLSIFPNPFTNTINIVTDELLQAKIYTTDGKLVTTELLSIGQNTIDLSQLNSGIYILKLSGTNSEKEYCVMKD